MHEDRIIQIPAHYFTSPHLQFKCIHHCSHNYYILVRYDVAHVIIQSVVLYDTQIVLRIPSHNTPVQFLAAVPVYCRHNHVTVFAHDIVVLRFDNFLKFCVMFIEFSDFAQFLGHVPHPRPL